MSFAPVIVGSGYAGWQFLQTTLAKQQASFDRSPELQRAAAYFGAKIGKVTSVDGLLGDRRLLTVALGAFGLAAQINSTALIRKVLTEGTTSDIALANRLGDKRWLALARAFDWADGGTPTTAPGFAAKLVSAYQGQEFQAAVSSQDSTLGTALEAKTALPALAAGAMSEAAKWYSVLGSPSLRGVFEAALGLPASVVSIDVDRQVAIFQTRAQQVFGAKTVSQFSDPATLDKMIKLYTVRSQASGGTGSTTPSAALQILGASGASGPASGVATLFS